MFPFFPSSMNDIQAQGQQNRPQMPVFNNQNMIMPNQSHLSASPSLGSVPNPLQATIMGVQPQIGHPHFSQQPPNMNQIAGLQFPGQIYNISQVLNQLGMQQLCGQLGFNGQMQNLNQFYQFPRGGQVWPQNLPQNFNQAIGFQGHYAPQTNLLPLNQCQQSSQNINLSSHHTPFGNVLVSDDASQVKSHGVGPSMGSAPTGSNGQQWPNKTFPFTTGLNKMEDTQRNFSSGSARPAQVSQDKHNNNGFSASQNFKRNSNGYNNRDHSQRRFQKQNHNMGHSKGYGSTPKKNWDRGPQEGLERTTPFMKHARRNPGENGSKLSTASTYLEEEVRLWREARKRNFPSTANLQRKLEKADGDSVDSTEDTKLRRQQLKEVLKKQRELGFEAAEVPSSYLFDSEKQPQYNHGKRGRGSDKWQAKKQRPRTGQPPPPPVVPKQSLLQKLLSSEIKRDASHLLQVFRFMTLNTFFDHWPEKPLEFPNLTFGDGQISQFADGGDGGGGSGGCGEGTQTNELGAGKQQAGEISEESDCVTDGRGSSDDEDEGVVGGNVGVGQEDSK
ncbi:GATA zinc finger protein [Wolffia australiana]